MVEQKFYTPLKIGLLTVTVAYFLFNLHTMLTLEWIGEWARTPGVFNTIQLIEDINATIGNSFRMVGSVIAIVALIIYFVKKSFSKNKSYLIARVVLVFEAIYWFGLLASGASGVFRVFTSSRSLTYSLGYVLPAVLEATIVPITLIIFAYKLSPNKPMKNSIKWGLISGTVLVFVYWLLNTGIWILVLPVKGTEYLTYPYVMVAFISTALGLLALTVYSVYATKTLSRTESLQDLNLKPIGVIILGLGLFYLWNYLTWIFFGGDHVWSSWYAWLLGHNMDLWMLSLPLVGLPLLFNTRSIQMGFKQNHGKLLYATQGVGAVFVAIFLAAYLGGLPSTDVLHSEPIFRIPLIIFGAALLILILATAIMAAYLRNR
ncbi:MAG: hypothetical protein ABIH76_09355 [Candidatus Bathyarchaeota archaeon]